MVTISFLGGARSFSGSQYLVDTGTTKVLLDCGLVQGCHHCEGINTRPFAFDPKKLDAVIVSHAHIDHTGLLPRLVAQGFRGQIFSTPATRDFTELLLHDSAHVMQEEAAGKPEECAYTAADIGPAMERFVAVEYEKEERISPDVTFRLHDAGHVLGSAIIELVAGGVRIGYSGDLGNPPTPLLRDPEVLHAADYLLVESTYGDRIHEDRAQRKQILEDMIEQTIVRKGVLMLPTFAFERAQELLFEINSMVEGRRFPRIPIFIDSPLAAKATDIYKRYPHYYNKEAAYLMRSGDELFRFPGLTFTASVQDSKHINAVPSPKVIMAGSGMMQGGRMLHHARRYLSDPNSTLLIVGYQAAGSLGRHILSKAPVVRIFGERVSVRCSVKAIGGYSAHADQNGLFEWVQAPKGVKQIFVIHGEEHASLALRQRIRDELGIEAEVPYLGTTVTLTK